MLKFKNTVTEVQNVFDWFINRLDTAEEKKISEFEYTSIKTSKTKKHREKDWKKTEQNSQGLWNNYKRCNKQTHNRKNEEWLMIDMSKRYTAKEN